MCLELFFLSTKWSIFIENLLQHTAEKLYSAAILGEKSFYLLINYRVNLLN